MQVSIDHLERVVDISRPSWLERFFRRCTGCCDYLSKNRALLHRASWTFDGGTVNAVVGSSGAGKSTLLKMLAGVIRPTFGEVDFRGFVPSIAYIGEDEPMLTALTVYETVYFAQAMSSDHTYGDDTLDQLTKEALAIMNLYLFMTCLFFLTFCLLSVPSNNKRYLVSDMRVYELSMAQKAALKIAVALAVSPNVLIADGITCALSEYEKEHVFGFFRQLTQKGCTIILGMNHPVQPIAHHLNSIVMLAYGRLVYAGAPSLCKAFFEEATKQSMAESPNFIDTAIANMTKYAIAFKEEMLFVARSPPSSSSNDKKDEYVQLPPLSSGSSTNAKSSKSKQNEINMKPMPPLEQVAALGLDNDEVSDPSLLTSSSLSLTGSTGEDSTKESKSDNKHQHQLNGKEHKYNNSTVIKSGGKPNQNEKEDEKTALIRWSIRTLEQSFRNRKHDTQASLSDTTVNLGDVNWNERTKRIGRIHQIPYLIQRFWRTATRLHTDLYLSLTGLAIISILTNLVWSRHEADIITNTNQVCFFFDYCYSFLIQRGIKNKTKQKQMVSFLFVALFITTMAVHAKVEFWIQHYRMYITEQRARMYSSWAFIAAQTFLGTLEILVACLVFVSATFRNVFPKGSSAQATEIFGILVLHAMAHSALVEAVVFATGSQTRTHIYTMIIVASSFLFSGFIVSIDQVASSIQWLWHLSYTNYAFEG